MEMEKGTDAVNGPACPRLSARYHSKTTNQSDFHTEALEIGFQEVDESKRTMKSLTAEGIAY